MMLKDLRLIGRDRFGLIALLIVPIVVIVVVASATQSGDGSKSIVFPVVNEDQGPVATALIRAFREHLDVRDSFPRDGAASGRRGQRRSRRARSCRLN